MGLRKPSENEFSHPIFLSLIFLSAFLAWLLLDCARQNRDCLQATRESNGKSADRNMRDIKINRNPILAHSVPLFFCQFFPPRFRKSNSHSPQLASSREGNKTGRLKTGK